MANLFFLPYRPAYDNAGGLVVPGAQVYFTNVAGTAKPIYSNEGLTTQRSNPVVADGIGKLPTGIYMDPAITYRVRIYARDAEVGVDTPLQDFNPYVPGVFADAAALQPVADAAEASAIAASEAAAAAEAVVVDATAVTAAKDAVIAALAAGGSVSLATLEASGLPVNLKWFGATGDGVTNDAAAMSAALAYCHAQATNAAGVNTPELFIPAGEYLFGNTTFDLTRKIKIRGENREGTVLKWSGAATGFRVQGSNTTGATGVQVSVGYYGVLDIEGLTLDGGYAGGAEGDYHGIHARSPVKGRRLNIQNWPGEGTFIRANTLDGAVLGNANGSDLEDVIHINCRIGLYNWGADVNACSFRNVSGFLCRQWAIRDRDTIGNSYLGGRVEGSAVTGMNDGTATHPASIVYYAGSLWFPTPGQEANASTNAPPSATVTITIASPGVVTWTAHGLAEGTPVTFNTTGALPTGLAADTQYYVTNPTTNTFQVAATRLGAAINTSGSQSGVHKAAGGVNSTYWNWWRAGSVTANYPLWASGITVRPGGGYFIEGDVNYGSLDGVYFEGEEINIISGAAQIVRPKGTLYAWQIVTGTISANSGGGTFGNGSPSILSSWYAGTIVHGGFQVGGQSFFNGDVSIGNRIDTPGAKVSNSFLFLDHTQDTFWVAFRARNLGTYNAMVQAYDANAGLRLYGRSSVSLGTNVGSGSTDVMTVGGTGFGYVAGMGGTVTQATNKSTAVTLNKVCGEVTMNNASLAAATIVSFVINNSQVVAGDRCVMNHVSGGTLGAYTINPVCGAGTITVYVRNNTGGALGEALVLGFSVIKGVNS